MIRGRRIATAGSGWLATRLRMGLVPSIVTIVVVVGGYGWLLRAAARHGGSVPLIVVLGLAPAVAVVTAVAVLNLFPAYVAWIDERIWSRWQGRYQAFDDHPVRVTEAHGELWFASDDVHAALGIPVRPAVLARLTPRECRSQPGIGAALSIVGLRRLLGRSTDRTTLRFLRWADGDVRRPWLVRRGSPAAPGEGRAPLT